jgi:hypothetical protein
MGASSSKLLKIDHDEIIEQHKNNVPDYSLVFEIVQGALQFHGLFDYK